MVFAPPAGFVEGALGALLWIVGLIALLVFVVVRGLKYAAITRREGDAWCAGCKYALTLPCGDRCPECGAALQGAHTVVLRKMRPHLSWRARIIVLSVIVWYPFLAPVYLAFVSDALDDWFVRRSAQGFFSPPSQQYDDVTVDAEWVEMGPILDGEVHVTLNGVRGRESMPTVPLIVDVGSGEASFEERGARSVCRELPVSAAFVRKWMRAQGVNVDVPPSTQPVPRVGGRHLGIDDEIGAFLIEIERRGGALPVADADRLKAGDAVFRGWAGGVSGPRTLWRPWWYWPSGLALVALLWTALIFAVRPRTQRPMPYASPA